VFSLSGAYAGDGSDEPGLEDAVQVHNRLDLLGMSLQNELRELGVIVGTPDFQRASLCSGLDRNSDRCNHIVSYSVLAIHQRSLTASTLL